MKTAHRSERLADHHVVNPISTLKEVGSMNNISESTSVEMHSGPASGKRRQPKNMGSRGKQLVAVDAESMPVWRQEAPKTESIRRLAKLPWRGHDTDADSFAIVDSGQYLEKAYREGASAAAVVDQPLQYMDGLPSDKDAIRAPFNAEPAAEPTPGEAKVSVDPASALSKTELGSVSPGSRSQRLPWRRLPSEIKFSDAIQEFPNSSVKDIRKTVMPPWRRKIAEFGNAVDGGNMASEPSGPSNVKSRDGRRQTDVKNASDQLQTTCLEGTEVLAMGKADSQGCRGVGDDEAAGVAPERTCDQAGCGKSMKRVKETNSALMVGEEATQPTEQADGDGAIGSATDSGASRLAPQASNVVYGDDLAASEDSAVRVASAPSTEDSATIPTGATAVSSEASSEPEAEAAPAVTTAAEAQCVDIHQRNRGREGDTSKCVFCVADLLHWRHVADDLPPSEGSFLVARAAPVAGGISELATPSKTATATSDIGRRSRQIGRERELQVSESSWGAQQRRRRSSTSSLDNLGGDEEAKKDMEVARSIKSILNKLTIEKFGQLSQKLMQVQFNKSSHVATLVEEVFEKSTLQHHFIGMYADLCEQLHDFFGDKFPFKRLLLNECQASFERHLIPPQGLDKLDAEDRAAAEAKYKMRMLGNIKFVGALLSRRMLASKVMMAILEELLGDPTEAALEAVAALLTVIGPTFDTKEVSIRPALNSFFLRVKDISRGPNCCPRLRCLLQNVLELRASGWQSARPKQIEAPTTLQAVAQKAASVGTSRSTATSTNREDGNRSFEKASYQAQVGKTLTELRNSRDGRETTEGFCGNPTPPLPQQAAMLSHLLTRVVEERHAEIREIGFRSIAMLFTNSRWQQASAAEGFRFFTERAYEELLCDVPSLPQIWQDEARPAMTPLVSHGIITSADLDAPAA
eukprot:TRINITY_DN6779_c0_g1_i1.p1 TRINITY_DN6779_c0_g1~~TRINITY_DN6779_c0_g1_i1.p1  ORF type:complete len:921 (-),score=171.88 TRINITY_DN6779_c0_g1_i1:59-2821(-)